jgi:hypothetical protein
VNAVKLISGLDACARKAVTAAGAAPVNQIKYRKDTVMKTIRRQILIGAAQKGTASLNGGPFCNALEFISMLK